MASFSPSVLWMELHNSPNNFPEFLKNKAGGGGRGRREEGTGPDMVTANKWEITENYK